MQFGGGGPSAAKKAKQQQDNNNPTYATMVRELAELSEKYKVGKSFIKIIGKIPKNSKKKLKLIKNI
jgi:hypothetical protein